MAEQLDEALARVRALLLDEGALVRAVAAGRRKGARPQWRRAELRYVELKGGTHLQVTTYDDTQAFTANHAGDAAAAAVDELLDQPFGNWHVRSTTQELQLRVTKKGEALVHARATEPTGEEPDRGHDRAKNRLLPEDDPVLRALGISDERGRVKPSRQAKYRQVEEMVRALGASVDDATAAGALRTPTDEEPLRVVDLGCGNAYLTFAAHRYLTAVRGIPAQVVGIDVKEQSRLHSTALAEQLGIADSTTFLQGEIGSTDPGMRPDVVLALHACDTATDDALAQAVRWEAPLVLAAPCCHHDVAAQLRRQEAPAPYSVLTRDGILRERFADTLTDALRAGVLRSAGYRVDVVEFVESRHTPRNTLLRAIRTGARGDRAELDELTSTWRVRPRLQELLA
ncbi:class I SAM-dependent methyltransferase [Nocardioides caldifontis]|uniref:class I SAM-dependent methyltransferase n=1 Tax=Nocardioides caldifontis TaxID=2588938 RepID=UPI0011DF3C33|nr:SAM-dependent methyltransferase [Nocardioides caldifontis]